MPIRVIGIVFCLVLGTIFFDLPCLATSIAPRECVLEIRNLDRYDSLVQDESFYFVGIYARVRITSIVKLNSTATEVHYSILDSIKWSELDKQTPNTGMFIYHIDDCNKGYKSLKPGQEYIFSLIDGYLPTEIYFWGDMAKQSLQYLKSFAELLSLKPDDLAKTIRSLSVKDPKRALILFKISNEHGLIPKSQLASLGYRVYMANGNLEASYDYLTAPYATVDDLFLAIQLAIRLKKYERALDHIRSALRLLKPVVKTHPKTLSSIDLKYWKSFIASESFQLLKKDTKQLQAIVQEWVQLRTCGFDEYRELMAGSQQLDLNHAIVTCINPPTGTVVWWSSLPLTANQNPASSIVMSKPYNIYIESADSRRQSAVISTLIDQTSDPEEEGHQRVLSYRAECNDNSCKYRAICRVKRSASTLRLRLPTDLVPEIYQMEHEFMRLIFGISKDYKKFKRLLEIERSEQGDIDFPYPSFEGYVQLIKDVKSACNF